MGIATPSVGSSNKPHALSTGDPQGEVLGNSASDPVGFFGATPVVQPAGNAQAAVTRGQACGTIISFTAIQSPTSVQAGTSSEFTMTLLGATAAVPTAAADLIYISKPTSQAGLTVGNVRGKAVNQIGVTFANLTGTTITPTAGETYAGIALRGFNPLTATISPAAVLPNSTAEQLFTVTGIRTGEVVQVNKPTQQAGLDVVGCRVAANNQIGITFMNDTSATITPTASEAYTVFSMGGLDAANNEIQFQITASPVSVQANTAAEYAMPVTGLALGDAVKGVSKPSYQAGLMVAGWRVSVPSTIGVVFYNNTGTTITPTAGEVYEIAITRANPVAPALLYTPTLTPTAVPGNSSAEQTFTVTGLIANTPVWVNKPTAQPNLGISGVRVSATKTLAINFCNTQAASITPTAAEVYSVLNFQDPTQTGGLNSLLNGNSLNKSAVGVVQQSAVLGNAHRTGLVNLGLEAGS